MKILHVGYFDAANAAWHMSEATKAHTKHDSRTLMLEHTSVARNADGWLDYSDDRESLLAWADVLVWHVGLKPEPNGTDIHQGVHTRRWFDKKPAVFWINGSKDSRARVATHRVAYADIPLVATTPDLCRMYEAEWMPVCIPEWLDRGDYQRSRLGNSDRLLAIHTPTDPAIKNTANFDAACRAIEGQVEWHVLGNMPYKRCMAFRASCDVTFDHMQGYYGACAVEALALGQPVIVHLDETCRTYFKRYAGVEPPVIEATDTKSLRDALLGLAAAKKDLPALGAACRAWYVAHFSNAWKARRWAEWLENVVGSSP